MLRWSLAFFAIAIIAALFGFGGIAEGASEIGSFILFIFVVLFVLTLLGLLFRGRRPRPPSA